MELVKAGDIKIWLSPWVIAELIWVFSSVYDKPKEFIIDILKALMVTSGVIISNQKLVAKAMFYYIDENVDFEDAMIALEAQENKVTKGISFDKHFKKFSWLEKWQPPEDVPPGSDGCGAMKIGIDCRIEPSAGIELVGLSASITSC